MGSWVNIGVNAATYGSHGQGHDRDQFLKKDRDCDRTMVTAGHENFL